MTTQPVKFGDVARDVMAQLAATSAHYQSYTDRGIDPFAQAGADLDDLEPHEVDANMLGLTQCSRCDWNFPDDEINYGCTDVSRACFDCHAEHCTDRTCREWDDS